MASDTTAAAQQKAADTAAAAQVGLAFREEQLLLYHCLLVLVELVLVN